MRKEITTNLEKADKYHKHYNIQKNIFVLVNCLLHFYNTFSYFLAAHSLITSSYDNDFVMSFCIETTERQFSLSSNMAGRNLSFNIDSLEKLLSASRLADGNVM